MFCVYVLKSKKDNKLYIGHTENLRRRISEHQRGEANNTKHRLPIELIYYESYKNIDDVKERERSFKNSGSVYNGLVKRIRRSIEN